ncbi:MAG: glycosyltransferase [Gammaproteobacteria bacterium]|nr:glycosyltransferase [Gammaproteobacteria bacterium]
MRRFIVSSIQLKYIEPCFSLVIPTRDRPDLVVRCLEFIRRQTYNSFEIILSDNGSVPLSKEIYSTLLDDHRFRYVRPEQEMNMADHWEFAVSFATGDYVSVLSEKFMLRPDALSVLADLVKLHHPGIMTWQFERFEVSGNDVSVGHYHPLMKPSFARFYSPAEELRRRFSFETPVFSRTLRHMNSYGKLYSGCVRRDIIENVRKNFGRVFYPYNPDFTSMIGILNESDSAIDVGQSLMIVVFADGFSTGDSTKISLAATAQYFENYQETFEDFSTHSLFEKCWVGHNNIIAFDYQQLKNKSMKGPIKHLEIDKVNLFSWMLRDLSFVQDFGDFDKTEIERNYQFHQSNFDVLQKNKINSNLASLQNEMPCPYEIFHSGLTKIESMPANISPSLLAIMHWKEGVAPPRKNVLLDGQGIEKAMDFFYKYSVASLSLLGVSHHSVQNAR